MKICMISYSHFQFDNRVHRYAKSLFDRGDEIDVISLGNKGKPKRTSYEGVELYQIQTRDYQERGPFSYLYHLMKFFLLSTCWCTRLQIKRRYDVIHFHNIPDFGVFCTCIAKCMGAKVILDIHDLVPEFYQRKFGVSSQHMIIRFLRWIEKISCTYSDCVITVTEIWKKTLISRSVPDNKCRVILNSPDPQLFFPPSYKIKSNKHVRLVYHGNLSEIFGVDLAIRAMQNVVEEIKNIEFHIYGQGKDLIKLKEITMNLQLGNVISFHHPVQRSDVPKILKMADIGIDPKRKGVLAGEGLSSKCMEYLAMGLPAVVSKTRAASTYYHDKMVSFFQPGNVHDLSEKIIRLCHDKQLRESLVDHAAEFNRRHSWYVYQEKYFHILEKLTIESLKGL